MDDLEKKALEMRERFGSDGKRPACPTFQPII